MIKIGLVTVPSDVDGRSSALLTPLFLLVGDEQVQMGRNRVVSAGIVFFSFLKLVCLG